MTSPSSSAGPTRPALLEPLEPADVAFDIDSLAGNYFIAAYPPFSTWLPEHVAAVHDVLRRPAPPAPLGLYVHVPFCVRKCRYCYYLSWTGKSAALVDRFAAPLLELESKGWLRTTPDDVRLTREGLLRVDALLPRFYRFEHRGARYA